MKRTTVFRLLLSALILIMAFSAVSPAQTASGNEKVRVWVQFAPGSKANVERALNGANAEFHYAFDELEAFVVSVPEAALQGLSHNPNVVLIEEDAKRYPMGQEVPYGIDMVQARDVWDADRNGTIDTGAPTGAGRTICIIDSGLYTSHADMSEVNVIGGYPTGWNTDKCGHGTHVAGTIAAVNNDLGVVGVTPGAVDLFIVKVFGDDCAWAYSSTLSDAANRCVANDADVISMSLGGAKSSMLERRAFDNAYSKGVLPIAAAGNEGTTAVSYPGGYASVVSVGAVDSVKAWADFSQFNASVELAAPGVGILSTVPYLDESTLTVDDVTYDGNHVEFAALGTTSGALVNGGLCDAPGSWNGNVVLCERGVISFYDKVMNVQTSGGAAAVLYNNEPGNFLGTLGEGFSSEIPAISISQENGLYLIENKIGASGNVSTSITIPASGYEAWHGTSMATPHVSAVAALVWSANPDWTNAQIREALTKTAEDLGAAGRDVYYGFGLVRAKAALDYLGGGSPPPPPPPPPVGALNVTVATDKTTPYTNRQTVYITTTVKAEADQAVASAAVTVQIITANGTKVNKTCTTGPSGICTVSLTINTAKYSKGTYTVTSTATKDGYDTGTGTTTFQVQ